MNPEHPHVNARLLTRAVGRVCTGTYLRGVCRKLTVPILTNSLDAAPCSDLSAKDDHGVSSIEVSVEDIKCKFYTYVFIFILLYLWLTSSIVDTGALETTSTFIMPRLRT